jgi:activating signal cointegrator 1
MKSISLLQPWAQLVVMGAKRIETRSWNTQYRGPLLIHASKKIDQPQLELTLTEPFVSVLKSSGYVDHEQLSAYLGKGKFMLPLGAIIGKVNLVQTIAFDQHRHAIENKTGVKFSNDVFQFTDQELAFGDFGPGRYGWLLQNPVLFKNPIPYKGSLSIWEFPDELLKGVL